MRNIVLNNFMTLVLACFLHSAIALAAVTQPEPNLDQKSQENEQGQKAPSEIIDTIDITPVGKPKNIDSGLFSTTEYFFPFRNSVSARMGAIYNSEAFESNYGTLYLVGFQYLFHTKSMKGYELGADLLTRGTGRIHASRRWLFNRTRTRPFGKAGIGWRVDPDQGISTFIRYQNLLARGGFGVEHLLKSPLSLRGEIEIAAGTEFQEGILSLGYSWAW